MGSNVLKYWIALTCFVGYSNAESPKTYLWVRRGLDLTPDIELPVLHSKSVTVWKIQDYNRYLWVRRRLDLNPYLWVRRRLDLNPHVPYGLFSKNELELHVLSFESVQYVPIYGIVVPYGQVYNNDFELHGQDLKNDVPGQVYNNDVPGQVYNNDVPGQVYNNDVPGQVYNNDFELHGQDLKSKMTLSHPIRQKRFTHESVLSCPTTFKEWTNRASKFDCSLWHGNHLKYHCALNGDGTGLVEVCAPLTYIHGHSCTEFNTQGDVIQESFIKCSDGSPPCPKVYNSTEAYKYPSCYDDIQKRLQSNREKVNDQLADDWSKANNTSTPSANENLLIPIGLLGFICLILLIALALFGFRLRMIIKNNRNSDDLPSSKVLITKIQD